MHFQAGYFEGMTELEKYKMYKKAQMMLAIKKLKAEEKAVEEMVAEEEVGSLETLTLPGSFLTCFNKPDWTNFSQNRRII